MNAFRLIALLLMLMPPWGSEYFAQSEDVQRQPLPSANAPDRYKLVFVTESEGRLGGYVVGKEDRELALAVRSSTGSFVSNLNAAGKARYRVIAALPGNMVAVMQLDEGEFEYEVTDTKSGFHFAKSEFWDRLSEMNGNGFRMINHALLSSICEPIDGKDPVNGESCIYIDRFLFEREKGSKGAAEQIVVNAFPGWGAKPSVEMSKEIEEKLASGFYPFRVISPFEVVLNRLGSQDEQSNEIPEAKVVRSGWGTNDLKKKIERLGKQGYRLAATNNRIAVLYRNNDTKDVPVKYFWLRADKKNFYRDMSTLQLRGARYTTNYPNGHGAREILIFEHNLKGVEVHLEYQTLSFEFDLVEDKVRGKITRTLNPVSKDAVRKMNQLATQGYVVRDMFNGKDRSVSVLLERKKKPVVSR